MEGERAAGSAKEGMRRVVGREKRGGAWRGKKTLAVRGGETARGLSGKGRFRTAWRVAQPPLTERDCAHPVWHTVARQVAALLRVWAWAVRLAYMDQDSTEPKEQERTSRRLR